MIGVATVLTAPLRYLRNRWGSNKSNEVYESPLELSHNDDKDSLFDNLFAGAENLWTYFDRSTRQDAEEKVNHEVQNSGHAIGAVKRIANDVVGKEGPTVQIIPNRHFKFTDDEVEEYQETLQQWLEDMEFHRKLKTMLKVLPVRGESIGHFHPVTGLREREIFDSPLRLNFRVVDTRRLDSETSEEAEKRLLNVDSGFVEGVQRDAYGLPDEYRFDTRNIGAISDEAAPHSDSIIHAERPGYQAIRQELVVHLFHEDVAEQRRGFTQMSSSILPSSLARKASMSIGKRIRKLAMMFGFIEQQELPPGAKYEDEEGNKRDACELERATPGTGFSLRDGMVKFLGGGMKFNAPAQNSPSTGSESFLQKMIGWLGAPLCAPLFWITGDFSKTNFTSGRMGLQGMDGYRDDLRDLLKCRAYKRAIRLFHERAPQVSDFLSDSLIQKISNARFADSETVVHPKHPRFKLHWPGRPAISPLIEARGKQIELMIGTKSHAELSEDADVRTRWKCEADLHGITLAQYQRLMLASKLQMDPEKLEAALEQDARDIAESDDAESNPENMELQNV